MVISMLKLHSKFEFCNDPSKLQCLLFKIWFINKVGICIKVSSMISIRNQMCNQLGKKIVVYTSKVIKLKHKSLFMIRLIKQSQFCILNPHDSICFECDKINTIEEILPIVHHTSCYHSTTIADWWELFTKSVEKT